jgi:hypothetical protein
MHEVQTAADLAESASDARRLAVRESLRNEDDNRRSEDSRIGWHFREAGVEQMAIPNRLACARGLVDVLTTSAARVLFASLAARVSTGNPNSAEISCVASRRGSAITAVRHYSWQSLDTNNREAPSVRSEVGA